MKTHHKSSTTSELDTLSGITLILISALGSAFLGFCAVSAQKSGLSTESILFWRFSLSAAAAWLFFGSRPPLTIRDQALALLMGAMGFAASALCYFHAIMFLPTGVASVLLYAFPSIVMLLSWAVDGVRPQASQMVCLATSALGCALVVDVLNPQMTSNFEAVQNYQGILFGLGAAFFYSGYLIVGRNVLKRADTLNVTRYVMLGATIVFVNVNLARARIEFPQDLNGWAIVATMAVICTVMPAATMLAGVRRLGPNKASVISSFEPVMTMTIGYLALSERLHWGQIVGAFLVVGTVGVLAAQSVKGLRAMEHP